jgi:hypothetical protein
MGICFSWFTAIRATATLKAMLHLLAAPGKNRLAAAEALKQMILILSVDTHV